MAFRLACVFFPTEKKNYVVPLEDVVDLPRPRSKTDFNPEKKYKVRWEVLRRENSETTEDFYEGFIQLIAATHESLVKQASERNIRLPRGFLEEHSKMRSSESAKGKNKGAQDVKSSKHARKQVALALDNSTKQRMSEVVNAHKSTDIEGMLLEPETAAESQKRSSSEGTSGPSCKLAKKSKVDTSSETSMSSNNTTKQQATEIQTLQRTVASLEQKVSSLTTQNKIQSTELISANLRLEAWERAFKVFSDSATGECAVPSLFELKSQESSNSKVTQWLNKIPSDGETNSAVTKLNFDSISSTAKPPGSNTPSVSRDLFGRKTTVPEHSSPVAECSSNNQQASLKHQSTPGISSPWKGTPKVNACSITSINNHNGSQNLDLVDNESTKSSKKVTPEVKAISKKNKSLTNVLRDGEKTGKELAQVVYASLKGEQPLQENGKNQVHIGNNVWIHKNVYEAKIKNGRKLSLAVRDLAEDIWGFIKCSEMSLTGGPGVKDPSAPSKCPAPAHEREAILGVFRAKLMSQGLLSEEHLDRAERTEGLKYLREKFQDSDKKRKAAAKQKVD